MADTNLVYPYEFEGGTKAVASEVNANFEAVKVFANGINATLNDIQSAINDLQSKPTREMFDVYYSFSAETPIGAYPLWTGETITNCKSLYPDFWKKLNQLADKQMVPTVDSDEYEDKLEEYGQCASFYIDTLNGHVRLPKITRFISSIADLTELAKVENSANTAHTHNVKVSSDGSKNGYDTATGYLARGYTKYSSPWSSNNNNGENKVLLTSEGEEEGRPKNVKSPLNDLSVKDTLQNDMGISPSSFGDNSISNISKIVKSNRVIQDTIKRVKRANSSLKDLPDTDFRVLNEARNIYNKKFNDKYKHAYINCLNAQQGTKNILWADYLSRLKEIYDIYSKNNTREESEKDMDANLTGRFLGLKYPDGDCDELVQRYYKKQP